ncbi:SDR family oxidoreductase [Mameliella sediminis]|uniref:SDR family oxidoreductase n=1 Tax=Mameliella sediminis TaxID=2836866 RepID=UPI001C48BF9F|nr:SDR family oxidoreductase [Mameliella sediminis]MBV7394082.1 SDR family oxidoreductase [Mameliella sediminis]
MSPDASFYDGTGRTVMVSGGTSGINRGIARRFAESGAKVFVLSRSADKVADTIAELRDLGAEADGMSADVRKAEEVEAAFARCAALFGPIDVVISGAAGNFPAWASDISSNGFRAVMEIDVLGTHHVMMASYAHMRRPGLIVNISAAQAHKAMIGQAHVCAAKAGVDQLTRTLALEWGHEGLRINSVSPGPIEDTEGFRRVAPTPEDVARRVATVPLRRTGHSTEVADLCLFLASDRATYITGAVIPVDGGAAIGVAPDQLAPSLGAPKR